MRIFIADDNPESLRSLATLVRRHTSAPPFEAESVSAALHAADTSPPDILISQVFFSVDGGENGFTLRKKLTESNPRLRTAFLANQTLDAFTDDLRGSIVFQYPPLDETRFLTWLENNSPTPESTESDASPPPSDQGLSPSPTVAPAPGTHLGDYELVAKRRVRDNIIVYKAVQTSVRRTVALELLKPELTRDGEAIRAFRAMVRAKAAAVHQHLSPVYEASEEGDVVFFTRELVTGKTLAQLANKGVILKQDTLLSVARATAEAFDYLRHQGIHTTPLTPDSLYLDKHHETRVANLAVAEPDPRQSESEDLRTLARSLHPLIDPSSLAHNEISALVKQLGGPDGTTQTIRSWHELVRAAGSAQQRLSDIRSLRPPKGTTGSRTPPSPGVANPGNRTNSKNILRLGTIGLAGIAAIALGAWWVHTHDREDPSEIADSLGHMARVSVGSFVYQDGESLRLDSFWIDEYEVTIAEYAQFLDSNPGSDFDHPNQPPEKKTPEPDRWEAMFKAARRNGGFAGHRVSLRCPVFSVDWWDAHAYARWKGRQLPTEQQWEKAARGRKGKLFPWGNTFDPAKVNCGDPLSMDAKGAFSYWTPVGAFPDDSTDYHAFGMAGNVSEWTASTTLHPEIPDKHIPVVRGGSFASEGEASTKLTTRLAVESHSERRTTIGFRTVSPKAPK